MVKEKPERNDFARGVGWMGVSKVVTQLGSWVATIIIARLLMPADYGLVGMSGLLVGIVTLMGDFGLNASIIQKKDVTFRELSILFWLYILLGACLSCMIYLLAPLGCLLWGEPELLYLIRISALAFFFSSMSMIPSALLQKKMKFREYGFALSIAALSGSVVSIILAYYGMGPYSLILGTLVVNIVSILSFFMYEPFVPMLVFSPKETIDHLKFGGTLTIERYLWWYYSNCDFWLASKFLGKNAYGSYSMAFQLASLPIEKITSIVNPVALSTFSKITDNNEREKLFFSVLRYVAYISFPVFVGFFWAADDIINIILGEKWVESIVAFKVFVLIFPLRCLASLNSPLLNSIRRADVGVRNMAIGAVLASVFFVVGVQYGIVGLAYSWLFFYPLFYIICLVKVLKVTGISLYSYVYNLKLISLNMLCMSFLIYLFQRCYAFYANFNFLFVSEDVIRLIGTIIFGVVSFFLFGFIFDKKTVEEVRVLLTKKRIGI